MQIHPTKVLVLDDDEDMRFAIGRILRKCECDVVEADSVSASIELLEHESIDVIFSDMRIPGADGGAELLAFVSKTYPDIPVVLMSCAMDDDTRARLKNQGATECLQKPFYKETCMELLQTIREPIRKSA